jgi:hypothetical protein
MPDIFPGLIAILESLLSNENPQLVVFILMIHLIVKFCSKLMAYKPLN